MIDTNLQVSLRSKFNPDGSVLRQQQLRMLEILRYFDEFCRNNGIKYWLSSGTLLGAVRHGGFIPWDDDLDIEMLESDFNKFISLRDAFETENFIYQDFLSDDEYIAPFGKIRDKKSSIKEITSNARYYKYDGCYIDIFVRKPNGALATKLSHVFQYLFYKLTNNISNRKLRCCLKKVGIRFRKSILFPALSIFNKQSDSNKLGYSMGYGFYDVMDIDWIMPTKLIRFENGTFPIPNDTDLYLKEMYGDYNKLPDVDNIKIHVSDVKFW